MCAWYECCIVLLLTAENVSQEVTRKFDLKFSFYDQDLYSVHYLLEIDHKVKSLDQIKYFIENISFKHNLWSRLFMYVTFMIKPYLSNLSLSCTFNFNKMYNIQVKIRISRKYIRCTNIHKQCTVTSLMNILYLITRDLCDSGDY